MVDNSCLACVLCVTPEKVSTTFLSTNPAVLEGFAVLSCQSVEERPGNVGHNRSKIRTAITMACFNQGQK